MQYTANIFYLYGVTIRLTYCKTTTYKSNFFCFLFVLWRNRSE